MIIEHQIVTDEEGRPTAALIPWDEFEKVRGKLAEESCETMPDEIKDELDSRLEGLRSGSKKAIPHNELIADLRSVIADVKSEP